MIHRIGNLRKEQIFENSIDCDFATFLADTLLNSNHANVQVVTNPFGLPIPDILTDDSLELPSSRDSLELPSVRDSSLLSTLSTAEPGNVLKTIINIRFHHDSVYFHHVSIIFFGFIFS